MSQKQNKITKQLVNDESYKKYSYTTLKLKNTDIKLYIADNDLKKQKGDNSGYQADMEKFKNIK